jgi:hypothetical protein
MALVSFRHKARSVRNPAVIQVHVQEPECIPQLVGKIPAHFELGGIEFDVLSLRTEDDEAVADSIGTVLVDHLQWIDAVVETLAHFAALLVLDNAGHENIAEGGLSGEVDAAHEHPADPEKQDVVAGYKYRRGVEVFEVTRFFRPAKCGERPEPGRKPGIQHIGILHHALLRLIDADHVVSAVSMVPSSLV